MALFDSIKAIFKSDPDEPAAPVTSASEYVEWLIGHMLRKSRTELRLDTSHPLPTGADAPSPPAPGAVINRLKVLCGLNPFRLPEPAEGAFERERANHRLLFKASFEDRDERSICVLRLSIRA